MKDAKRDPEQAVTVRAARDSETVDCVHRLREEVFIDELGYDIVGSFHESGETARALARGMLLLAKCGNAPAGTMAIDWWKDCDIDTEEMRPYRLGQFHLEFPKSAIVTVRKWLIRGNYRSLKVCMALLKAAVKFIADKPDIQFVCIDCLPNLIDHYQSLGFRRYAPAFHYGGSSAPCVPMCLVVGDHIWLARIRSPLLPMLRAIGRTDNPAAREYFNRIYHEWEHEAWSADRMTGVANGPWSCLAA